MLTSRAGDARLPTTSVASRVSHQRNADELTLRAATLVELITGAGFGRLVFTDSKNRPRDVARTEVVEGATAVAAYLMSTGLQKGDRVALMLPTSKDFIAAFFGTLMAGGVPVPTSQPASTRHLEGYFESLGHVLRSSEAAYFLTHGRYRLLAGGITAQTPIPIRFAVVADLIRSAADVSRAEPPELPSIAPGDPALIQYTSGTTGAPKGVVLSHHNLLCNVHSIGAAIRGGSSDVVLSWLPLYHDMGLIGGLLTSMYWDTRVIFMPIEAFLFKPQWYMENITAYGVTITVAPNFGYHYCLTRIPDAALPGLDLHTLRVAFNGAEPIDVATLERFIRRFAPCGLASDIFFPVYGMAENTLAATFPAFDRPTVLERFDRDALEMRRMAVRSDREEPGATIALASVGFPLPGQEIKIVDDGGETVEEGRAGEILIRGPCLTRGYFRDDEATARALRDGWFHSGDVGFIQAGMLFVSGRGKEVIIKRGRNIYPYDIERVVSAVEGIRLGCVAAFGVTNPEQGTEDIVLFCESSLSEPAALDDLERAVVRALAESLNVAADVIRILPKGALPKTTSGKTKRLRCKELYLQGSSLRPARGGHAALVASSLRSLFHLGAARLRALLGAGGGAQSK